MRRGFGTLRVAVLNFLQREIRADHMRVALNAHGQAIAQLDLGDMLALLVHQKLADTNGQRTKHFA